VLIVEKAADLGMTIHSTEIMPDHVHLFIEFDPTRSIAEIANRIKGYTSRVSECSLAPSNALAAA
jgi:putative transposase